MDDTQFQALLGNLQSGISRGEMEVEPQALDEFDKVASEEFGIQPKKEQKPKVDIASRMVRNPVTQPTQKSDIASRMVRNPDATKPTALTDLSPEQKAIIQGFNPTGVPVPGYNLPGQREKFISGVPDNLPGAELTQGRSLWDKVKAPSIYDISNRYAEPTLSKGAEAAKFVPIAGQAIATAEGTGMMGAQVIEDISSLVQGRDAKQVFTPRQYVGKALEAAAEGNLTQFPGTKGLGRQVLSGAATGAVFGTGGALQTNASNSEALTAGLVGGTIGAAIPVGIKGVSKIPAVARYTASIPVIRAAQKEADNMKIAQEIFQPPPARTAINPGILEDIQKTASSIKKVKTFKQLSNQLAETEARTIKETGEIVAKNYDKTVLMEQVYTPIRDKISAEKSDPMTEKAAKVLEDTFEKELNWQRKHLTSGEMPFGMAQERKVWYNSLLKKFFKKSEATLTDLEISKIMALNEIRSGYMTELAKTVPEIGSKNELLSALASTRPLVDRQSVKAGNTLTKRGLSGIVEKIPGISLIRKIATGKVGVDDMLGTRAATLEGELGGLTKRLENANKAGIVQKKSKIKVVPKTKQTGITRAGVKEAPQLTLQERKDVVRLGKTKPSTMSETKNIVVPKKDLNQIARENITEKLKTVRKPKADEVVIVRAGGGEYTYALQSGNQNTKDKIIDNIIQEGIADNKDAIIVKVVKKSDLQFTGDTKKSAKGIYLLNETKNRPMTPAEEGIAAAKKPVVKRKSQFSRYAPSSGDTSDVLKIKKDTLSKQMKTQMDFINEKRKYITLKKAGGKTSTTTDAKLIEANNAIDELMAIRNKLDDAIVIARTKKSLGIKKGMPIKRKSIKSNRSNKTNMKKSQFNRYVPASSDTVDILNTKKETLSKQIKTQMDFINEKRQYTTLRDIGGKVDPALDAKLVEADKAIDELMAVRDKLDDAIINTRTKESLGIKKGMPIKRTNSKPTVTTKSKKEYDRLKASGVNVKLATKQDLNPLGAKGGSPSVKTTSMAQYKKLKAQGVSVQLVSKSDLNK